MDDRQLLAKFGPGPPPPPPRALLPPRGEGAAAAAAAPLLGAVAATPRVVLAVQFLASAALLVLLQPPFAMTFYAHAGGGMTARLNPVSVLVVSACAVGATVWLDASFKRGGRF